MTYRIGNGFDLHRWEYGRRLVIGGVEIKHEKGLLGHSDADALTHAVIDALLGALALGDIGQHFPDTDPRFKNVNSIELLQTTMILIQYSPQIANGASLANQNHHGKRAIGKLHAEQSHLINLVHGQTIGTQIPDGGSPEGLQKRTTKEG